MDPITKPIALELIKTKEIWAGKDVYTLVCAIKLKDSYLSTNGIKVGDVYDTPLKHPAMVFKIKNSVAYSVMMTTKEINGVMKCNSRFYSESYFTDVVIHSTIEEVVTNMRTIYDCPTDVITIKKLLKTYYKSLFK